MKFVRYSWILVTLMMLGGPPSSAQAPNAATDIETASLEQLLNVEVTSASKREERLFRTASAIYVITQEEIRRSGLNSIPEVLRLAPGLEVGRIDGNKWAISARGLNGRIASKLLVLIDGRAVYSPEHAGVYWEAQSLPLEEIDRIEIVRGPGGTLWGANAVNGVINIITKQARDFQGGLVTVGGGSEEQGFTSAHYGWKVAPNTFFRLYGRYFNRGGQVDAAGRPVRDWQSGVNGGFRLDWQATANDALTWQGRIYDSSLMERSTLISLSAPFAPPTSTPGELTGGNVLGRWNHRFSDRSDLAMQAYFDRSRREISDFGERIDTYDFDLQQHLALGRRQALVGGLGYRLITDQTNTNPGTKVQYFPKARSIQIFSAFVQDELTLVRNQLRLTVGTKVEHNDYSGYEWQPSARLIWTPNASQTLWTAVSRAVRTPARYYRGVMVNLGAAPGPGGLPTVFSVMGNQNATSEELLAYEFGYRVRSRKRLSVDLTTFYNSYDRLTTFDFGQPFLTTVPQPLLIAPIVVNNLMRGKIYGLETSVNWDPTRYCRFRGIYSFLRSELAHRLAPQDPIVEITEGTSPRHQFQLHSYLKLPGRLELDGALYHVSNLPTPQIPSYARLDLRLGWHVREGVELSLGLQNLLDRRHPEFDSREVIVVTSQVKRSIYGKVTWSF
ncbi:MAG TPA: TonB-dependent receptor [Blastocatellia bacterium]|nr:TonB-dependent receptor [Blastocatellia bacterium]